MDEEPKTITEIQLKADAKIRAYRKIDEIAELCRKAVYEELCKQFKDVIEDKK